MTDTTILIAIGVVLLVVFPAIGWKSLQYLRKAPDIPHKREMMRGAKWGGWLAMAAAIPLTIAMWSATKMSGARISSGWSNGAGAGATSR